MQLIAMAPQNRVLLSTITVGLITIPPYLHLSLFLKNNGAEAPKVPMPIVFKELKDTRTFFN
jgi:hypothetical protein